MSWILKKTTPNNFLINDVGQTVPGESELNIDPAYKELYARSVDVISALLNGTLIFNDGVKDLEASDAIDVIRGFTQKFMLDSEGKQLIGSEKPSGESMSIVSHDFCDKTTWFTKSIRVEGEVLTGALMLWNFANNNLIDLENGKHAKEDKISAPYLTKIYVDGVLKTSGFTINYAAGTVTFNSLPGGVVTADYSYATEACWLLEPASNFVYVIEHAELDFAFNVQMKKVHFDVWAYNPAWDDQVATDPDSKDFIPGVSSGNPRYFLYDRVTYKNFKDILKIANDVQVIEPLFGLTNSAIRAVFDYGRTIDLKSSQGMQLRISTDDNEPLVGEWGTITLYIVPRVEV